MTNNFEKDINVPSKKIIIDRVNVKECKYYCNGKCERYEEFVEADYANYSVKCICEKENDLFTYDICDYQQLKRKEQEYKTLEEIAKRHLAETFEMQREIDQLKAELEQEQALKETYLACYRTKHEDLADKYETLKAENEELKEIIQRHDNDNNTLLSEFEDDLVEYYRRHRECLIEIKEIANKFDYWNSNLSQASEILHEIIEKISEVLDEEV